MYADRLKLLLNLNSLKYKSRARMVHARKQTYQLRPRMMKLFPHLTLVTAVY